MKNSILILIMLMVLVTNAYSQAEDKMILKKEGNHYLDGQLKKRSEIKNMLANTPVSAAEYHKFVVTKRIGIATLIGGGVMAYAGGRLLMLSAIENMIGAFFQVTSPVRGEGLMIAGTGVFVAGVVILAANPHFGRSVNLYNSSVKSIGSKPVQLNLTVNPYGMGLSLKF